MKMDFAIPIERFRVAPEGAVIPADHKWVMRALVSHIITTGIHALDLSTPKQDEARRAALSRARKALEKEEG